MRFLFACGGTAGHINPAVGVADRLKELVPDCEILFIGAEGKMETELVPKAGYEIRTVPISNLSRSLSREGIRHNLKAAEGLAESIPICRKILKEFHPDVVVGTGGYVCYPVLSQASRLHIPTAVHESNAEPGLTTRMLEKSTELIMVGFEAAKQNYKCIDKVHVTGTPVRLGFLRRDKMKARKELGLDPDEPLVVSVWGSLGATEMNKTIAKMVGLAVGSGRHFRFVHSAGKRGIEDMTRYMKTEVGMDNWEEKGFYLKDYIYDMPLWMEAADLILCRSGASTLAELTAMGKPAVLVPSPNVVNNHQEKNARILENAGAAVVITEDHAAEHVILDEITTLLSQRDKLEKMAEAMRTMAMENATDEIASLVLSLAVKE